MTLKDAAFISDQVRPDFEFRIEILLQSQSPESPMSGAVRTQRSGQPQIGIASIAFRLGKPTLSSICARSLDGQRRHSAAIAARQPTKNAVHNKIHRSCVLNSKNQTMFSKRRLTVHAGITQLNAEST